MDQPNSPLKEKVESLQLPQIKFWRALMACHELFYKHFEFNLQSKGLSYSRFQILFYIYFNPKSSAVFLAEKMNVTRGNMSMFLKRLIEDQLIVEEFSLGKKRCTYKLSKSGITLFEKSLDVHLNEVITIVPEHVEDLEKKMIKIMFQAQKNISKARNKF